jgi:signal recognition particle receptor subunit beta
MKTQSDRTLFFDLLPLDLGEIMGYKTRFLLYTVPGQVFYNATRKLVLKGADAIVFVADSAIGKMEENKESLANLRANLTEYGVRLEDLPFVLQYNKRDLPNIHTVEELNAELNPEGTIQVFEAVATQGAGVFETFRGISHLLMQKVTRELRRSSHGPRTPRGESFEPRAAGEPARAAAAAPPRTDPAFEPPPIEIDQTASAPPVAPAEPAVAPVAAVADSAPVARTPSPELDYGREIGLAQAPDRPAEPTAAHGGEERTDLERAFPDEPLTFDRTSMPPSRDRAEAAPARASGPQPVATGGFERTLTLDPPAVATAPAASPAEVVVPVKLPRGARCEIVLRIVIQDEDVSDLS